MRSYTVRRMAFGLLLLGSLGLAGGCSDPNPATSASPEEAKAKGQSLQNAMEKTYAPGGAAVTKKPSGPAKADSSPKKESESK